MTPPEPALPKTQHDEIVIAYLIDLTAQVRTLAKILRDAGISVPTQIGTLGPAPRAVQDGYGKNLQLGPRTHHEQP